MKRDVSRPSTRSHYCLGPFEVTQRTPVEIQSVNEHAIRSEVSGEGETVRGIGDNAVSVRLLLTFRVWSATSVLDQRRRGGQRTIFLNRQHSHASAVVIGDEHHTTAAIHAH